VSCDLHSEITFDCLFSRFEFLRNIWYTIYYWRKSHSDFLKTVEKASRN
jgi:hypothetical protein